MLRFKVDMTQKLKEAGFTSYTARKTGTVSQGVMTKLKDANFVPDLKTLSTFCNILKCQPGDILEWVPDESEN